VIFAATLLFMGRGVGCGLFEPRSPEAPSQSSLDYQPPTDPSLVIANLESAVGQKSVANYTACFADPQKSSRPFVFIPSAEASSLYGSVLNNWSTAQEQAYFQNLIAKSSPNAYSSLFLTVRDSLISADSVTYTYDYVFTFEHNEPGFAHTARGNLQFTLAPDASNFWSIHRWIDFKTGDDITWSMFKGKFSN
jgi:hypothetical protein